MDWFQRAGLGLVAAACLAASAAPFDTTAATVYRDTKYKFSLYRFDKWEQVPVEVDEEYAVAKFYEPGSKGDTFRPSMEVLRLEKRPDETETPATEGAGPAKDPPKSPPKSGRRKRSEPKSIYEIATQSLLRLDAAKWPEDKNWKPVVSKDKVPGKFWALEVPLSGGRPNPDATLLMLLAAFEKDGVEYGILVTSSARRRETYEPLTKAIAKSFLFFDEKAKDVATFGVLDGINISPERRKQIEEGIRGLKSWDVIVSPKKNYVVVYNTKNDTNKELARTLADRIERIREQIYEKQFPPAKKVETVSVMRVCGDATEYHAYGGPQGSAGYWNSHSEELVFYDASRSRRVDDNTLAVLYHEAFHQYIFYSVGNVAPHSWFNEGHGDYYAGAKYGTSKFTISPFRWRIGTLKTALTQGPRSCKVTKDAEGKETKTWGNTGYTPLKDLVEFSQADYYAYPAVSYAQGWSLIYFLREEVPKKKEWNAKWGKILPTYFDTLKRLAANDKRLKSFEPPEPPPPPPTDPTTHPTPPAEPTDPTAPPTLPPTPADPGVPSNPKDPGAPTNPADPTQPAPPVDPNHPGDPPPTDPSKPGDPSKPAEPTRPDDPTKPGDPPKPPDEPVDPGFQPMQEYADSSPDALHEALKEAFRGIDFAELEAAWFDTMKHVN